LSFLKKLAGKGKQLRAVAMDMGISFLICDGPRPYAKHKKANLAAFRYIDI